MLRAHRQAWAWQDEYYGLTIDDIRELERQTQLALHEKMALETNEEGQGGDSGSESTLKTDNTRDENINTTDKSSSQMTTSLGAESVPLVPIKTHSKTSLANLGINRKPSVVSVKSRKSVTGEFDSTILVGESIFIMLVGESVFIILVGEFISTILVDECFHNTCG